MEPLDTDDEMLAALRVPQQAVHEPARDQGERRPAQVVRPPPAARQHQPAARAPAAAAREEARAPAAAASGARARALCPLSGFADGRRGGGGRREARLAVQRAIHARPRHARAHPVLRAAQRLCE